MGAKKYDPTSWDNSTNNEQNKVNNSTQIELLIALKTDLHSFKKEMSQSILKITKEVKLKSEITDSNTQNLKQYISCIKEELQTNMKVIGTNIQGLQHNTNKNLKNVIVVMAIFMVSIISISIFSNNTINWLSPKNQLSSEGESASKDSKLGTGQRGPATANCIDAKELKTFIDDQKECRKK